MSRKNLILALCALAFPAAAAAQEPVPPKPAVIAHRGGAGPDGTIACVRRSLEAGVKVLELDVRLTRDGQAVILHDPTLDRTTDGSGPVAEMTLDQVKKLDAGAKYRDPAEPDKSFAGERIPTVQEMIHFVGVRGTVLLELKVADAVDAVVAAIRAEQAFGRVVVRSADKDVLRRVKGLDARIQVGTMGKMPAENLEPFIEELQALGVVAFTVPAAERAQVDKFRNRKIAVWGSNTNDPELMKKLIEAGVDGIITDQSQVLAAVLQGRDPSAPPTPPAQEGSSSAAVQASLRGGIWMLPSFEATIPTGSREVTRKSLFDLGADVSLSFDPAFVMVSVDYGVSSRISLVSGSVQAGLQADLGELLVPLSLRGSGGVMFGKLSVDAPNFGDFDSGVGFLARVELAGRVGKTLTGSIWVEYRHVEFDFQPTVVAGDRSAGGSMVAFGLSLGVHF